MTRNRNKRRGFEKEERKEEGEIMKNKETYKRNHV
jgi:hypothetical protein